MGSALDLCSASCASCARIYHISYGSAPSIRVCRTIGHGRRAIVTLGSVSINCSTDKKRPDHGAVAGLIQLSRPSNSTALLTSSAHFMRTVPFRISCVIYHASIHFCLCIHYTTLQPLLTYFLNTALNICASTHLCRDAVHHIVLLLYYAV